MLCLQNNTVFTSPTSIADTKNIGQNAGVRPSTAPFGGIRFQFS